MSIEEMLEGLIVVSRVRRHFASKASLDQIIDLERILSQEAKALEEKIPGGLVVWDAETGMYGVYPADR